MPDPWVQGEELEAHEKAVAESDLTKQAEGLREQEEELTKGVLEEREEQRRAAASDADTIKPAEDGANADAVTGGIGPSGEQQADEPAGNADSTEPTQEEQAKADSKSASRAKKS